MTNFLRISTLLLLTVAVWIISGCTTQKVKGEYTGLKKVYHNTTQRYNGYFNATVLMEESQLTLTKQHTDNYNKILPIFEYTKAENPQAVAESLDEAMKKVSVAVNLHRGANWTDDCYLLLGQAQYLKQDYETAEETFEFMEVEFSNDLKKRGSLSQRARDREAKTKKEKEAYKKERLKQMKEEREQREDTRAEKMKAKKKEAKAKKKARAKEKKERIKAAKAYKKAREKARKNGTKPPPRPSSKKKTEEEKKDTSKPADTKKEEEKKEEEKEKEKKDEPKMLEEPESYFLKHRPVYREGILWLARTYIERDNWILANNKLTQLENDPKISKDVAEQLPLIRAYYFMEQKQYDQAVPFLKQAIEFESDRLRKARYAYIIAQIHDKSGNMADAMASYEDVLKFRPGYTMEFSTRLNILNSKYSNGKATAEQTTKELNRLLKDIKNEEYQDQIYYTLAQVAFSENKTDEGIAYLESSLSVPSSNKANQGEAYYKLAQVYLEKEDYVNAKSYFDSTIGILPKSDERYEEAETFAKNLTAIAENLQEIELQDSLIRLSKLTDEERRTRTFEIKKAENEARRQAILAKAKGEEDNRLTGNNYLQRVGTKPSSFFAYDDRGLKKGAREFIREWGLRSLKDNWRTGSEDIQDEEEDELDELAETVVTDEDVNALFKDVPDTPEKKKEAEKKIEEAMFNLGRLYRDKLAYNEKAVQTLNGLLQRNPKTKFEPDALYYLYLAHQDLGNTRQANEAKNKLLQDYAETTFARVVKDPEYAKNNLDQDYQLNKYYDETYNDFKKGQYKAVQVKLKGVPAKFGEKNSLAPRFALLNAMTIGNLQGKDAYVNSLKDVIAKYPNTSEQTRAKEILRLLGVKGGSSGVTTGGSVADGTYKVEEEKLHYMIVVFNEDISLTDVKVKVSDYHSKYHKLDKLRISNIYLGGGEDKVPLIVVRRFKNKDKAMEYYDGVQKNKADFVAGDNYSVYPVTQNNYRQILKSKTLAGYDEFFEENYK